MAHHSNTSLGTALNAPLGTALNAAPAGLHTNLVSNSAWRKLKTLAASAAAPRFRSIALNALGIAYFMAFFAYFIMRL